MIQHNILLVVVLPDGNLCVVDSGNNRLQVLDSTGEVQRIIGAPHRLGEAYEPQGLPLGKQRPASVECDGEHLFVVESSGCRVQKLSLHDGSPLASFGTGKYNVFNRPHGYAMDGELQLWSPSGIASLKESVYVTDSSNHRVVVLDYELNRMCSALGKVNCRSLVV